MYFTYYRREMVLEARPETPREANVTRRCEMLSFRRL